MKFTKENKITALHLAASELFNAIKFFAVGFVKASHVIPVSFAFTPALLVERTPYVFIVTILISIRMILWTTALCMFNLIQVFLSACIDAAQIITTGT